MRIILSSLMFLLAFLSVLTCARGKSASPFPDFEHAAYAPLVEAEGHLEKNEWKEALGAFRVAFTRAARCGRNGVAARIRARLASAGMEAAERSGFDSAWAFMSYYAVSSPDFGVSSRKVENWFLSRGGAPGTFTYQLFGRDGKSAWGHRFHNEPVFVEALASRLAPGREGGEDYQYNSVPVFHGYCRTWSMPVKMVMSFGVTSTEIRVRGLRPGQKFFVRANRGLLDMNDSFEPSPGELVIRMADGRRYISFYEMILQTRTLERPDMEIQLVRKYAAL